MLRRGMLISKMWNITSILIISIFWGHNDFKPEKSIWDHKNPEDLLRKFAGTGHPERGTLGMPGYKETVDFKEYIGIWKNSDGTIQLPTTRGTIHYSKKGAHIVPARPSSELKSNLK